MDRIAFAKLCEGTAEMLALVATECRAAGSGELQWSKPYATDSIKPLAEIIAAISASAKS